MFLVHCLFVCFVRVSFCCFSLPPGVGVGGGVAVVCDFGTPWTFLLICCRENLICLGMLSYGTFRNKV